MFLVVHLHVLESGHLAIQTLPSFGVAQVRYVRVSLGVADVSSLRRYDAAHSLDLLL
jgi:hypothetical protein